LSLDSAKNKAVMTSKFIEYMEQKAFLIAEKLNCLGDATAIKKNYPEKRVAMN
jgi:hypothetical protein